jgi:hypothetical protein
MWQDIIQEQKIDGIGDLKSQTVHKRNNSNNNNNKESKRNQHWMIKHHTIIQKTKVCKQKEAEKDTYQRIVVLCKVPMGWLNNVHSSW